MNIALLGGAFNPPHMGHVLIAQQVLDFAGAHEVWFLPLFAHSFEKPLAAVEHRLAMTRMMVLPKTTVSTLEIDHKLSGQTIELLPHLPKQHSYRFIIGSDQLPSFHMWGKWEQLIAKLPFLVFPRYGYPSEPLYANMTVVSHRLLVGSNISSTKIRDRVKAGLSIDNFVPPGVSVYIKEHGLYR